MASPYHHHQNHPPTTTTCCRTTSFSCHCTQSHLPSYPPPQDPLLQAIASQLLISNPPDPYLHHHHHHQNPHKTHKPHHPKHPSHIQQQQLHSLLSRVEALEASLHHHSSNRSRYSDSYSLRDYAARKALALLIQLDSIQCGDPIVRDGRRSISRDLVRFLEFIERIVVKRQAICLKPVKNVRSNVRPNVRNVQNVSKSRGLGSKCGDLGKDQRVRIGKLRERIEKIRGFARVSENEEEDVELEGFQHVSDDDEESGGQYENGAAVKGCGFQPKVKKSVSFAENENVFRVFSNIDGTVSSEDGSDSSDDHGERVGNCSEGQYENGAVVKRCGLQPKVKKSVSFAENENVFRVFSNIDGTVSSGDGSDSSDDHGERVGNCCEVEDARGFAQQTEDGDDTHLEIGGSPQTSDAERIPRARMTQRRSHGQGQNEHLLFSAPLPVKMDPKEDVMKRNMKV
ncbi:hypothetical protein ACLB2K_067776 [Fragaria x ananassa]